MTLTETIRVSDGGDLLSVLPYVVGFHLDESVVVVLMRTGRLAMTARFDRAAFAHPGQVAERLGIVRAGHEDCQLLLAAFGSDVGACHDDLALLETLIDPADLIDSLVTDGTRWWSRLCDGYCCPAEGRPLERASAAVATAIALGFSPLSSRDELAAMAGGPSAERLLELAPEVEAARARWVRRRQNTRRARVRELVSRTTRSRRPLELPALLDLAVLVDDIPIRDLAWLMIRPHEAERHQQLWSQVVAVCPDDLALAPLSLLAVAGWLGGNGALLNCALDRGLELRQQRGVRYSMLDMLAQISDNGVPPSVWQNPPDGDDEGDS